MKITYDGQAEAIYIYFAGSFTGAVKKTETYQRIEIALDPADQIVGLRLYGSESLALEGRLKYALLHPEVSFEKEGQFLQLGFVPSWEIKRTIPWDANVDIDKHGQIMGMEILFTSSTDDAELPEELVVL